MKRFINIKRLQEAEAAQVQGRGTVTPPPPKGCRCKGGKWSLACPVHGTTLAYGIPEDPL